MYLFENCDLINFEFSKFNIKLIGLKYLHINFEINNFGIERLKLKKY